MKLKKKSNIKVKNGNKNRVKHSKKKEDQKKVNNNSKWASTKIKPENNFKRWEGKKYKEFKWVNCSL